MKVLVIGQGGREHAICWKIAQSVKVTAVFCAPGNAGTAMEQKTTNIDIAATDIAALIHFVTQNSIDLTIVGPEQPLAMGIVDQFKHHHLNCFGPTTQACLLESSKAYCKEFMQHHGIPSAQFCSFSDVTLALNYLQHHSFPVVIKADGLAAGKGVVIAQNYQQAAQSVRNMLEHKQFGDASETIVIEEFLTGTELSYIAMVDGTHILPLVSTKDHKKLHDHDLGPNTGGMGAFSPSPLLTPELENTIITTVMQPTVNALAEQGHPFVGFLYAGLMIGADNSIKVLEFNCRLGDPETQPILMRLQSDLLDMCMLALAGKLDQITLSWDIRPAVSVVMCSPGYPHQPQTGLPISGLPSSHPPNEKIFHAGTATHNDSIITTGGRVLCITALGDTLEHARAYCYKQIHAITWDQCLYRTDIADFN